MRKYNRVSPPSILFLQGIVYEVMQLAKLQEFNTGGTIQVVVNNQVSFPVLSPNFYKVGKEPASGVAKCVMFRCLGYS